MLSFVVVATEDGGSLPGSALDELRRAAQAASLDHELRHPVLTRRLWVSDTNVVAVVAWWSGWDPFGAGSPWFDEHGLTVFSGRLWPRGEGWRAGTPWAQQLGDRVDTHGRGRAGLSGQFCAVRIGPDGNGLVFADDVGARSIYQARRAGVHLIGNDPRLIATLAAAGDTPARDPIGVGWLAYAGVVLDDERTGFVDVTRVPHAAHVTLGEAGTRIVPGPTPFDVGPCTDRSVADAVDVLAGDLRQEMAAVASLTGQPMSVGLTGGKDSRTVLAAALMAGVAHDLAYHTFGRPDLPDQVVAGQLRDRYGLHEQVPRRRPDDLRDRWHISGDQSRLDRIQRSVYSSSGVLSVGDMEGQVVPLPRVTITGTGGEVLSTNYSQSTTASEPDDLYAFLYGGLKAGATGFIRHEHLAAYDRVTDELATTLLDEAADVREAVDRFYLRVRMNRFFGMTDEWDTMNSVRPLLSSTAVGVARSIGSEARRSEVLQYEVMRLADPELPHLPFAEDAWHASLPAHVDDGTVPPALLKPADPPRPRRPRERLRRITMPLERQPPAQAVKRTVSGERRAELADEHHEIFRRHLVDDPSNPAFEVLDHEAVTIAVERFPDISPIHERHLFGALTAAMWLGHHERRPFV